MAMDKNFDAKAAEPRIYDAWDEAGAFVAGANAKPGAESFCIMIPPPNVTGSLHMGHAFNNTLQDILTRWHRMRGFDVLWQPGMDHAGIATQMVVERQLGEEGKRRTDFSREDFIDLVWKWKEESGGTIKGQLQRLGASCDWSREAFTMSGNFPDAVLKTFVSFYDKGLIFKGKRLVNWDPHFETAISDLEVENVETPGHMWHFKYPLAGGETYEYLENDEDGNVTFRETRDYISIATTRPETMLGDGAVAVHPDDARYAPIVGKLCEIPVGPKEHRRLIPIITDEYPDMNFGSGAVKITGAHDFNDYEVAKRGGIPMYALMDGKGAMRSDGKPYAEEAAVAQKHADDWLIRNGFKDKPEKIWIDTGNPDENWIAAMNLVPEEYRGLDRFEARKWVVADITAEGLAVMVLNPEYDPEGEMDEEIPLVENKPIMQPFGDRSKVVIEPMLTDQWFVDTAKVVEPALEAVRKGETQILPEQHKKVYFNWLENIEPWCISRQLWWGHQVPVWYGPGLSQNSHPPYDFDKGEECQPFCASTFEEASQLAFAWYKERGFQFENATEVDSYDEVWASKNGDLNLKRDEDVLDTWFSSGLWPLGTLGWPDQTEALEKYYPTSVLITGFDIIFFWVARMMMMQLEMDGRAPFHTVYVHALVRDEKGKKMSKSLGNVMDPLDLIDEFGADAVRFTLTSMAAMGRDLKLSTSRIQGYRNFTTKLWNAAKYAEHNGRELGVARPSPTATANKWIIGEVVRARIALDSALEQYRFNDAADVLYRLIRSSLCDFYVEFSKPLFRSGDEALIAETRATLNWALDQCLILAHPAMPFITEELWGERGEMLVVTDWPEYGAEIVDADADAEMEWVIALIENVRSLRVEMNVPAGEKLPLIALELDAAGQAALERNKPLILGDFEARVNGFESMDEAPKGGVTIPVKGGVFCLPLDGIVDFAAEAARVSKSLGKLEKEIGGLSGKLKNPKFLANAPEEVVREQQGRLEAANEEAEKLRAAVARMEAIS